jgi:hypothetical protein
MQPKLGKRMCMNPSSDIVRQQPHRLEGMFFGVSARNRNQNSLKLPMFSA